MTVMNILNKRNMWKDYFFGRFWPVVFLHKTNDVYTLPVCVLQWKHESLKYYFSVDMAEVDLSDAEKIFIIHGVQVMFIFLSF